MRNSAPSIPEDLGRVAILLDVDGTILDLAPTPREVFAPHSLRDVLARLLDRCGGAVAFVSGRLIHELDLIFAPLLLPAIGGHGAEMRISPGGRIEPQGLPPLDLRLKRELAAIAEAGPGIVLEDKGYSLALHYRLAPEKEGLVRAAAARVCAGFADRSVELLPGKLVVEIKQTGVSKGTAVRKLMDYPPFAGRRPIFVGDDVTDLSVFGILPDYSGISISVGRKLPGVEACFERPDDVRRWLEQLSLNGALANS